MGNFKRGLYIWFWTKYHECISNFHFYFTNNVLCFLFQELVAVIPSQQNLKGICISVLVIKVESDALCCDPLTDARLLSVGVLDCPGSALPAFRPVESDSWAATASQLSRRDNSAPTSSSSSTQSWKQLKFQRCSSSLRNHTPGCFELCVHCEIWSTPVGCRSLIGSNMIDTIANWRCIWW